MVDEDVEYAEEYTFRERVRLLVTGLVIGGIFLVFWCLWLLPEFDAFSTSALCRSLFGISGVAYVWYGFFVGLPLSVLAVFWVLDGRFGVRILREGRAPPSGVKVLRRTRVKRGTAARLVGCLHLLPAILLLAVAVWGLLQARSSVYAPQGEHPACRSS